MAKKQTWDYHLEHRDTGEKTVVTGEDKQTAIIKAKLDYGSFRCYLIEPHTNQPPPPVPPSEPGD